MTHTARIQAQLVEAGYSMKKLDVFDWVMYDGDQIVGRNRSLGDLIHKQAIELGIW